MEPNILNEVSGILKMLNRMDKVTTIDESLIEEGIVLKAFIYEDNDCSVSMLMLSPQAKIKEHKHTVDSEVYYQFKTGEFKMCDIGKSHSLENPDQNDWLPVLSIKHKKK